MRTRGQFILAAWCFTIVGCATTGATKPDLTLLHKEALSRFSRAQLEHLAPAGANAVPKFASDEHALFGRIILRECRGCPPRILVAPGVNAPTEDLIALGGDFIRDIWEVSEMAETSSGREMIQYDLLVIREAVLSSEADRVPGEPEHSKILAQLSEVRKRQESIPEASRVAALIHAHALDSKNAAHFLNSEEADCQRGPSEKLARGRTLLSTYDAHHRMAVLRAYEAGRQGGELSNALLPEALGLHYLTDAFAAGHVRTPRRAVAQYWNGLHATFFAKFKGWMADQITQAIDETRWWSAFVPDSVIRKGARRSIDAMLQKNGIPDYTFGDLVGMALHDYDNANGVKVSFAEGGAPAGVLVGDGRLGGTGAAGVEFTVSRIEAAVGASIREVVEAYESGKTAHASGPPVPAGGLYSAERILPIPAPDDQQPSPTPKWKTGTWQALLADPATVNAITLALKAKEATFRTIAGSMADGYQKDALMRGVIEPLARDPIGVLKAVLTQSSG